MNLFYVFLKQKGNIVDCKYYRNRDKDIDFIFKSTSGISVCIDIKGRKFFQDLSGKLKIENKILITKDFDLSYDNGLLKVPYIIFLLS
jgi:predicted AAA+ superfamily ATPase